MLQRLIDTFQPITLEEMKGIKLMNRIDTKFVTTLPQLLRLLEMARDHYFVQQTLGERNICYHTVYFDTPRMDMFNVHQAGHAGRQKVRARSYVTSDLHFLEVKTKNNHGRTKKKRIQLPTDELLTLRLSEGENKTFLDTFLHYDNRILAPAMDNLFDRITLVNRQKTERLTIDTNLHFHNVRTARDWHEPQLVIVELKRDGLCPSPILACLRELRIHPHGFSKYCIGACMTDDSLRKNRFKPKIIDVKKILST